MNDRELLRSDSQARRWLAFTIALSVVAALIAVAQAVLLARVIAQVFLGGADLAAVAPLLLWLLGLALLRAAVAWAADLSGQRLATRVKLALREHLLGHILALGPAYTAGERSGELANTALGGVEAVDEYLSQFLPQVTLSALVPLLVLLWAFPLDPLTGAVLLLTAPLIPVFMWLLGSAAKEHTNRQWSDLSRLSAHFLDSLQGLTTLKLFGRSRDELAAVQQMSARFGSVTMDVLKVAFLSSLALELIASLSTAVVAVEIGLRLIAGSMSFEPALALLILAPEFYLPLRLLGQRHHAGMAGKEALVRIAAILKLSLPAMPSASLAEVPADSPEIRFQQVSLAYDQGQRPALCELDLRIPAGQTLALVGASGAGKSTVAQLLLGFLQPDSGTITVNGRELREYDLAAWRAQLAWVGQQPALFYGSVADNLRLAKPYATQTELESAARAVGAQSFISALPQGYATQIGEGGAQLSGGQRQRLALARALLLDAPFLILDEATSQLDLASEAELIRDFLPLLRGRTVLLITHRLNLATAADQVAVLEQGRIVELGAPSLLYKNQGAFFQLQEAYDGA